MILRVKSSQAQQGFGGMMDRALAGNEVIVERYGAPRVVILEYQRYQQLLKTEHESLRSRLQQASAAVSARASHLSEAEVDELIERARSEADRE